MQVENCPRCSSRMGAPLKSGRQVCANCGWSTAPVKGSTPPPAPVKTAAPTSGLGALVQLCFRIIGRSLSYLFLLIQQFFSQLLQAGKKNKPQPGRLLQSLNQRLANLEESIPNAATLNSPRWMTAEGAFKFLGGDPVNLWSEVSSLDGNRQIKFNNFKALSSAADFREFGLEYSQERRDANKPYLRWIANPN